MAQTTCDRRFDARRTFVVSAKEEIERLLADEEDYLDGMTPAERRAVLESHSWRDYLEKFAGLGEEALKFAQKMPHAGWAIGADAFPAWLAWNEGYPGSQEWTLGMTTKKGAKKAATKIVNTSTSLTATHHRSFAGRKLVPRNRTWRFDGGHRYCSLRLFPLDQPGNLTRIRQSSTVVGLGHQDGELDADVDVTYVSGDKSQTVTADKVVWAGYHAMLPHVCPDVPKEQVAALGSSVRAPLVYTNVLIRNWRSLLKLGLERAYCPGSFFQRVMFTHPVSMGGYRFAQSPDEPVVLHLEHIPLRPGLPAPDQFREGCRALLETSFETFERNVRDQLGRLLGPGGFDPARDIAGINR